MHVEWQRQKLKSGFNGAANNLIAVLVNNSPSNGQAHEKLVQELGSIKAKYLQTKARDAREFHQGLFWAAVDKKLDFLALAADVRKSIEHQILKEVPRPGEDWALWGVTCIPRYDP